MSRLRPPYPGSISNKRTTLLHTPTLTPKVSVVSNFLLCGINLVVLMNISLYIPTVSRMSVLWLFQLVQPKTTLSFRNQCSGNTSLVQFKYFSVLIRPSSGLFLSLLVLYISSLFLLNSSFLVLFYTFILQGFLACLFLSFYSSHNLFKHDMDANRNKHFGIDC